MTSATRYMVRGATLLLLFLPVLFFRDRSCTRVDDLVSAGETKLSHCIVRNSLLIRSSLRTKTSLMIHRVVVIYNDFFFRRRL